MRHVRSFVAGAVALSMIGACSSDDQSGRTSITAASSDGTSSSGSPDAEAVVDEIEVTFGPATLTVAVHPLVRTDAGLVLTLDVTAADATEALGERPSNRLRSIWGNSNGSRLPEWIGLRLLDLAGDRVMTPAVDGAGDTIVAIREGAGDEPARLQLVYGDPAVDDLALFVPQGGLVTAIPVIGADVPEGAEEPIDLAAVASAPVYPMASYAVDVASTTRTASEVDRVTIELGADVLFELDSADLTPASQQAIAAAAAGLMLREAGPVLVLGHTDNAGSDDYNLDLSLRRAEAVAASLGTLIDVAAYPLQVDGRGESEPVAGNTSDTGRAANRRVELTIETGLQDEDAAVAVAPELPPVDGPVATGAEGVDVRVAGRSFHVSASTASVVAGHLVVDVRLTATDQEVDTVFGPAIFEGAFPSPAGLDRTRTMAGMAVMNGALATIPALHQGADSRPEEIVPLTDLVTFSRLDGGDERTSVLVYPRGVPIGDTVTIQLVDLHNDTAWRLTDIPVG